MHKRILISLAPFLLVMGAPGAARTGLAQETPKPAVSAEAQTRRVAVYRLEFVVRELEDGKRVNSRSYTVSVQDDAWDRVRVGSRVPIHMGEKDVTYQDVGINIDCHLYQQETDVLLNTTFESSSVVAPQQTTGAAATPIVRQVRFSGQSSVTPGKPTVMATLDDVATNRRYEVEVTATKVR